MNVGFLPRVPTGAEASFFGEVPVACASEVRYALTSDGLRWVAKRCNRSDIIAESVGWLFARELKVPTVQRALVVKHHGDLWWLGEMIEPAMHWDESRSQTITNPDQLGRIIGLDCLLGNEDRHEKNILVRFVGADICEAIAIDYAGCWTGTPSKLQDRGMQAPASATLATGIPRTMVTPGALALGDAAERLSAEWITGAAFEACRVGGCSGAEALGEALTSRCAGATNIIEEFLESLK